MSQDNLLKSWRNMDRLADRLSGVSDANYQEQHDSYFASVERRIAYCREFLPQGNKYLFYYTLAELYDRYDDDDWPKCRKKRRAAYYALRAIREDRHDAPAWALLAAIYSWMVMYGGVEGVVNYQVEHSLEDGESENIPAGSFLDHKYELDREQKRRMKFAERSIACIMKAMGLDPSNETYRIQLECYYRERNEEFKPPHIPRNPCRNYPHG